MRFLNIFSFVILLSLFSSIKAQDFSELKALVNQSKGFEKAQAYHDLIIAYYRVKEYDSALVWANKRVQFAKNLGDDSTIVESIIRIGQIHDKESHFDDARTYFRKAYNYSTDNSYEYGKGLAYLKIALSFYKETEFDSSIYYSKQAERIFSPIGNKIKLTVAYTGIGNCNLKKGNLAEALDNYFKSLKIEQELKDTAAMASSYQNIGAVYYYQDNSKEALKYFLLAAQNKELTGKEASLIGAYHNIGAIYEEIGDHDSSLIFYKKAHSIAKKHDLNDFLALTSTAIGSNHLARTNLDSARIYLSNALNIQEHLDDKMSIVYTLRELAKLEIQTGNSKTAIKLINKAEIIGEEQGLTTELLDVYEIQYRLYEQNKQFDKALESYKKYVAIKDTMFNEEVQEKTIKMDLQHQFDQVKLQDSLKYEHQKAIMEATAEAEEAKKDAELQTSRHQKYLLFGGLIMVGVFLLFVFNRLNISKKQNKLIEAQKQAVEEAHEQLAEQHKEIKDSINYAKRIQDAIMPNLDAVNAALKNAFVLYLPKDVVAGDFFWMETLTSPITNQKVVYFAAADCTGHGVPGAMVSVVCSNALTKALLEEKITDTGKLLDRTRELVIAQLAKSGEDVNDGMDISLCALNIETNELNWSGANNPLWILRKETGILEEIKPDKQPIGKFYNPTPFTAHKIQLFEGDSIYIFTDGYQDQFGGEKGKKFKASQLKNLFLENSHFEPYKQLEVLKRNFKKWRGELEQIDDVCVIGVRV